MKEYILKSEVMETLAENAKLKDEISSLKEQIKEQEEYIAALEDECDMLCMADDESDLPFTPDDAESIAFDVLAAKYVEAMRALGDKCLETC